VPIVTPFHHQPAALRPPFCCFGTPELPRTPGDRSPGRGRPPAPHIPVRNFLRDLCGTTVQKTTRSSVPPLLIRGGGFSINMRFARQASSWVSFSRTGIFRSSGLQRQTARYTWGPPARVNDTSKLEGHRPRTRRAPPCFCRAPPPINCNSCQFSRAKTAIISFTQKLPRGPRSLVPRYPNFSYFQFPFFQFQFQNP